MDSYREIDLSQWIKTGEGGNGSTYENPSKPDVILKLNKPRLSTLDNVRHEFEVSDAVYKLGVQTPRMYELVRVGNAYATISERIRQKKSLSRICSDDPSQIEDMARLMCRQGKALFSTPCDIHFFPSRREQLFMALKLVRFVNKKTLRKISEFAQTIQEVHTCIHGDFNTGNLIMAEGRPYWIDLDRFGYGDPMFDIGHLYLICNVYSSMKQVQDIFHMNEEQLLRFWSAFAESYCPVAEREQFERQSGKFACLDIILRYAFQKSSLPEQIFFSINIHKLAARFFSE